MMEEVADDTNGESSFEFVGNSNMSSASDSSVSSHFQNPGSQPDQAIMNYFNEPSSVPPPSALPLFDVEPNISTPQSFVSSPPVNNVPCVGNVSDSVTGSLQSLSFTPTTSSALPPPPTTTAHVPPPQSKLPMSSRPPMAASLPKKLTPPVQPKQYMIPEPLPPPNSQQGMYYQPDAGSVPPCVPAAIYQPPTSSSTVNFSGDYVSSPATRNSPPSHGDVAGNGLFGWIKDSVKGSDLLNKFAEKAKSSVDSVIYTLDPQMKEFMNSNTDINIVVASDKEVKVSAIRESFQSVFIQANVQGVASQTNIAEQPIGFAAAVKGAEERIMNLRQHGTLHPDQTVIAIENFLLETTPDSWFDVGCLLLHDPKNNVSLQSFTQATPVPLQYVMQAQDRTPADYPLRWSGLAAPIGQIVGSALGVHHSEWHQAISGVSRKEILLLASKSLAGQYKDRLNVVPSSPTITM